MIDVRELRIGNLITYNKGGKSDTSPIVKVCEIHLNGITAERYYEEPDTLTGIANKLLLKEDFDPIVLSEETLLNCNFEKMKDEKTFILPLFFHKNDETKSNNYLCLYAEKSKKYDVYLSYTSYSIGDNLKIEGSVSNKSYIFLHQVQNLYFNLTGKELPVKHS